MATFTPSDVIDSNERNWAANLGMLDWDNTRIVFTKRSLIEFLKYTGTTVDTNYTNIQKLPRYAKFGKITGLDEAEPNQQLSATAVSSAASDFKPTRRVRTAPGGETHDIFGTYADDDDVLSQAPRATATSSQPSQSQPETKNEGEENKGTEADTSSATIRRKPTGNTSSSFWDPTPEEPVKPAFKPSRRVREMPGGRDSIADLL
ncbi:hypothetical protein K474DRAFT_1666638 [Panus rudis PR-1116 ss-1]|nr:hypothetical protein K474DRAFT_1666638 [Panus rudis PR-1116 ss-1]